MASDDITLHTLREIRDGIQGINQNLEATNARIDATNTRIDKLTMAMKAGFDELGRKITKTEFTLRTELDDSEAMQQDARFRDRNEERQRLEHCEQAIADIYRRLGPGEPP